ncbi:MAG: hypothetical protein GX303_02020 [Clostridiales bacterium]|nr:hypothetical protein [Clostridiales bacterium]
MYKYCIKRKNKTAELIVAALFLMSVIFLVSSMSGAGSVILSRFFCIAFFSLGVLLANRYLLTGFCYIINIEGRGTLSIVQKQGKKTRTVCRIDLDRICSIELVTLDPKSKKTERKHDYPVRQYNYCASCFPSRYLLLVYDDFSEKAVLKLDAEEGFTEVLTRLAGNATPESLS